MKYAWLSFIGGAIVFGVAMALFLGIMALPYPKAWFALFISTTILLFWSFVGALRIPDWYDGTTDASDVAINTGFLMLCPSTIPLVFLIRQPAEMDIKDGPILIVVLGLSILPLVLFYSLVFSTNLHWTTAALFSFALLMLQNLMLVLWPARKPYRYHKATSG